MLRAFWFVIGPVFLVVCLVIMDMKNMPLPGIFDVIYALILGLTIWARWRDKSYPFAPNKPQVNKQQIEFRNALGYSALLVIAAISCRLTAYFT